MSRFAFSMLLMLFSAAALSDNCDNLINNNQAYRDCVIDWYGTSNRGNAPAPWWKGGVDQGGSSPPAAGPSYQQNDPRLLEEIRAKARADNEYHKGQEDAWQTFHRGFSEAVAEIEGDGGRREAVFLLEKAKLQRPNDQRLIDLALANLDATLKSPRHNPATLQPLLARLTLSADDIKQLIQFRILLPVYLHFWSRVGFERYPAQFKYIHDFSYIADACTDKPFYTSTLREGKFDHDSCIQQRQYKGLFDMERKLDGSARDLFFYVLTARAVHEVQYGRGASGMIALSDEKHVPKGEELVLTKRIDKYEKQLGVRYKKIQSLLANRGGEYDSWHMRVAWDVRVAPLYYPENWQGVDFRNENQVAERLEQLLKVMPKLVNYKQEYLPLFSHQNSVGQIYQDPGVIK